MAKAKKTARKSAAPSSSKKGTSKGKKSSPKSTKIKKVSVLVCEYCNKSMKDLKTKKLHERSCKKKKEEPKKKKEKKEKDFESVVLKLKDELEDQRQHLTEQFKEREEKLHGELEEIKQVLRMEIEHRHKEQERRRKEEIGSPAEPVEVPTAVEQPEVMEAPPRAIDQIPMPTPEIPKRAVDEQPLLPTVEVVEVGAIEPEPEIDDVETQKVEVNEELISEMIKTKLEEVSTKEKDYVAQDDLKGINSEIRTLSSELADIRRSMEAKSSELTSKMDGFHLDSEFKRIDREISKFSEKIAEIMDEIGFGEHLNVSKIPPTILEIVYQATLDDLTMELIKAVGNQDAERISSQALEEVRLKTSGSELFKFDGRKIVTDDLAYSIEANLISAKQIQTTYDELLSRLLDNLPQHKAKNFRAMIKVKSQEFAVDRATMLTKELERLEKVQESSNQMLAALSAQVNNMNLEMREEFDNIKSNLLTNKADSSEIEHLNIKLQDWEEREASLMRDIGVLKAEVEMDKKIASKVKKEEKKEKPKEPKEIEKEEAAPEDEEIPPKVEKDILKAVSEGASSKTALVRETGLEENIILDTISKLISDKKVIEKKVGKRVKYLTPDKVIKEKLSDKIKLEKKEVPKAEKKKEPAKKEKVEEDKTPKPKPKKKKEEKPKVKEPPKEKKKEEEKVKPEKKKEIKEPKPEKAVKEKEPEKPKEEPKKPEKKVDVAPEVEKKVPEKKKKDEAKKEAEKEPPKEDIVPPSVIKSLEELTEDEQRVLEVITEDGLTRSGIQSRVGKDMNYTAVLRALRILIDSGYVGIVTKGRLTLYQKIKVEQMGKPKKDENKKEVK